MPNRPTDNRRRAAAVLAEALERRTILSAAPVGGEFRANTFTAGNQFGPAVAADGDGDFVAVWTSDGQDGSSYGVYARRYGAGGAAVGAEFRVNTTTAGGQTNPAVAADADGDFVVAWQSSGQDGSSYGVYAQRYNAAGVAQGGEFRVNTYTTDSQRNPAVAVDAAGNFVVAWTSSGQDGSSSGVYAQRYDAAGAPRGAEFRANTATANSQSGPAVAADADGDFVVAWTSSLQDGSGTGVYAQRYNAAGVAQGTEFRANTVTANSQGEVSVAADSAGDFVVAWQSSLQDGNSYGVYAQRYNAAGVAQGTEFRANTFTTGSQAVPAVAVDAGGNFVVTWQSDGQDGSANGVYAQQYSAAGVAQGTEFRVNTATANSQSGPAVAVDADGDFVVAWQSNGQDGSTPASYGVYAQRYDESFDAAGPVVAAVEVAGARVTPGELVRLPVPQATVSFSESLDTAGGSAGANSVTNRANWSLTLNGQDASSLLTSAAFAFNPASNRYEATLSFSPQLQDGQYVLTAKQAIRDVAGNLLDGDLNGAPGGDYSLAFALARVVPVGPEFRANTFTANSQASAAVAADADGDFVVAWASYLQDGSRDGVYAQRYDAAGNAQGGEFRVNTTTNDYQFHPAVAMDAAGDFVVAWQSYNQDGSGSGVYARRYNAAGAAQGGEFRVNTVTAGSQAGPAAAMDAGGDFVVAWTSNGQDGGGTGVYAQRYDAAGVAQGTEFRANATTAGNQTSASAAMDAAGGFVIAWQSDGQDGSGNGVYAQRYDAAGLAQGGEFRANTFTGGSQGSPAAAMDADGDFVVAWQSNLQDGNNYGIYAQRFNAAGVVQGGEFRVNTYTTDGQLTPSAAMDAAGDFVVAWRSDGQDGDQGGVYAQRYYSAGVTLGGEFRANTVVAGFQINPVVAMDAGGDFFAAWESNGQDGSGTGIYAQRYAANEAPTALGIGGVSAVENGAAPLVNVAAVFSDSTTASTALVYTVAANTNPGLFGSTPITSGNLTLNPAANAAGTATVTVRATDAGGLFVDTSFLVTVRPAWLTVPAGGVWSVAGTPASYTLTLTSGSFTIPSDPAALNPNLNISVASPATLTVNADVHIAGLTLTGAGAKVTFNGPGGFGLTFTGGSAPLAVPVPGGDPVPPTPTPTPVPRDPPNLVVGDVNKAEGNAGTTAFAFPVTLDRAGDSVVRVFYATANVTAAHGGDYLAAGGVLTFKPGETSKVVTVRVKGDTTAEADERFRVVLYGATGAVVADGTGVGTIRNDDVPPAPRVSVAAAAVAEGDAGTRAVAFDVTLDRAPAAAVTVRYATADGTAKAGGDYIVAAGTLTFRPGENRKRVTVYVKADNVREADEAFFLDLSGPAGAARGRGVIRNDD